jgi:protein-tyrosine-phosphatase
MKAEAVSAGAEPGVRVQPEVLAVMQEVGIDLSNAKPQKLTQERTNDAALLITRVAVINVPTSPACAGTTGLSKIQRDCRWKKFG